MPKSMGRPKPPSSTAQSPRVNSAQGVRRDGDGGHVQTAGGPKPSPKGEGRPAGRPGKGRQAPPRTSGSPLNALARRVRSPQARWQIDMDYVEKLNPEERAWLDTFTDEYYLSKSKKTLHSQDQLRERWRAYKQNARDVSSRGGVFPEKQYDAKREGDGAVKEKISTSGEFTHENSSVEVAGYVVDTGETCEDAMVRRLDVKRAKDKIAKEAQEDQALETFLGKAPGRGRRG